MSREMLRCSCVVGLVSLLAVVATAGAGVSPLIYRGGAKGVSMTVTLPPKVGSPDSRFVLHFTPAALPIWRRVKGTKLTAFCVWPLKNGGEGWAAITRMNSKRRSLSMGTVERPSTGVYTCGLHVGGGHPESWPWTSYIRSALVAARLRRSN